jgi:hypothetical protein
MAAALESATVAACRDHDANVGIRSYHLFRLPPHIEDRLSEVTSEGAFEAMQAPGTIPEIVERLTELGIEAELPAGSGPKLLCSVDSILKPRTLCSIAGLYARAVREESRIYPYFDTKSDD